jgi:1-acyl-sn-glycerol-3-phosphate acyltransferase
VWVVTGLNVRHRERLPTSGPAIVVANHNSHLNTLVLITMFPGRLLPKLRPLATADYFLRSRWLAWFALHVVGIIPIPRHLKPSQGDPLAAASQALTAGQVLILFPEGSRGEPEQMREFKRGVAHLARCHPAVAVIPVFLHGVGKALPRGEAILVPFFCDVCVGEPVYSRSSINDFMAALRDRFQSLAAGGHFPEWQ